MNDDAFRLRLPSRAEHLGTARSFAAAIARHYAVAGEAVEDLKLAISEACVDALVAGDAIDVRARESARAVRFSVEAPEDAEPAPSEDELGAATRVELIRTLFPDAQVVADDGRREIRFSLPTG